MSKWHIGSLTMDWNPSEDSGWVKDLVMAEDHAIGATDSIIQLGGNKAQKRNCKGITKSQAEHDTLNGYVGTVVTVIDHKGSSSSALIKAIKWDMIIDAQNSGNTYTSWKYEIDMVKR